MIKALLYKEWKKTKWFAIGILSLGFLLLTYIYLTLGKSIRFAGMEHLWDVVINRDQFLFRDLKYFPIAAGSCLGLSQFVPEMILKRIKLSLHLPLSERKIISTMLGFGNIVLLFIFGIQVFALVVFASIYFPKEFLYSALLTVFPWYMAGLMSYSLVSWICFEPVWKRKIINLLLAFAILKINFLSDFPGAYSLALYFIVIIPFYVLPFSFLSVDRFKVGVQD